MGNLDVDDDVDDVDLDDVDVEIEDVSADEEVVLELHPHWRRLVVPFVGVPLTAGMATFALLIGGDAPAYRAAVIVLALAVVLFVSGIPYLRWRTTRYVVTDRRVIGRSGIVTHYTSDVPLYRVADVHTEATIGKRLLRSGDLVLEGISDAGTLRLVEVPRVEQVQRTVVRLMEADDRRRRGLPSD